MTRVVHGVFVALVVTTASAVGAREFRLVRTVPVAFGRALAAAGGRVLVTHEGATWLLDARDGTLVGTFTTPAVVDLPLDLVSAALLGGMVLVGAPLRFQLGESSGGVYVFDAGTGAPRPTLTRPQPVEEDRFGWAMAAAGTRVVVGSPGMSGGTVVGAAYLVDPATGTVERTFTAPAPMPGDLFGAALHVAGDRLLVGAPDVDDSRGAVFEFDLGDGSLVAVFANDRPGPFPVTGSTYGFGAAVTRLGSRVVVGAPADGERNGGEVRLLDAGGVAPALTLASPAHWSFGATLVGLPDGLLIGAPLHGDGEPSRVYVTDVNGAIVQVLYGAHSGTEDETFGVQIARDGDLLAILDQHFEGGVQLFADTTRCGDGQRDAAEVCDDGNTVEGDGCDRNCRPTACGNGARTGDEECDDGNLADGDGCDHDCTSTRCGNGTVTGFEQCDDGNNVSGDGCSAFCEREGGMTTTTGTSTTLPNTPCQGAPSVCDDRDPCTVDTCRFDGCRHRLRTGVEAVTCLLEDPTARAPSCAGQTVPPPVGERLDAARGMIGDATRTVPPVARRLRVVQKLLRRVTVMLDRARHGKKVTRACANELLQLVDAVRTKTKGLGQVGTP